MEGKPKAEHMRASRSLAPCSLAISPLLSPQQKQQHNVKQAMAMRDGVAAWRRRRGGVAAGGWLAAAAHSSGLAAGWLAGGREGAAGSSIPHQLTLSLFVLNNEK